MSTFVVQGSFYARRAFWQPFTKRVEAADSASARERAVSQIGGNHSVKRSLIRIASVDAA